MDLDTIRNLRVSNIRQDSTVPIGAVADVDYGEGDARIERHDRLRRISVEANLRYGSLGQALDAIDQLPVLSALPDGVRREIYGDSEYMAEMFENFSIAMAAGILAMYAVLVLLFKGFLHPWTILCTVPLSLVGAVPALWMIGAAIDLPAIIGMLMLMGIVTKNAILLVDFTLKEMENGNDRQEAVKIACATRARPIVMTTMAMVAGMAAGSTGFRCWFRVPYTDGSRCHRWVAQFNRAEPVVRTCGVCLYGSLSGLGSASLVSPDHCYWRGCSGQGTLASGSP